MNTTLEFSVARCRFFLVFFVFVIIVFCRLAAAQTNSILLSTQYDDFAFDPVHGTLAAISSKASEIHFYSKEDLPNAKVTAKTQTSKNRGLLALKSFKDKHYFVACNHSEPRLYIFDSLTFKEMGRVPLTQDSVTFLSASGNPDDPYIYYCFGEGRGGGAAVDFRRMLDVGKVFDDADECVVSRDGKIVYRRRVSSMPTGFDALLRSDDIVSGSPEFLVLHDEHLSTEGYVPDGLGRFVACGNKVYSADLNQVETEFDFYPRCFLESLPFMIGINDLSGFRRMNRQQQKEAEKPLVTLYAASSNSMRNAGKNVVLDRFFPEDWLSPDPNGTEAITRSRIHVFRDEANQCVLVAGGDRIDVVPFSEFELPDEPTLHAFLESSKELHVGVPVQIPVRPASQNLTIDFLKLEEGMQYDGTALNWTPRADQLGPIQIEAEIKHADLVRRVAFQFDVVYPGLRLPFSPTEFAVSPDAKRVAIWRGAKIESGYPYFDPSAPAETPIAVLDTETGRVIVEKTLKSVFGAGEIAGSRLFLMPATNDSQTIEVLNLESLERISSLELKGSPCKMLGVGDILFAFNQSTIDAFKASDLARLLTTTPFRGITQGLPFVSTGVACDGMVRDWQLNPILLTKGMELPYLFQGNFYGIQSRSLPFLNRSTTNNGRSTIATAFSPIQNMSVQVASTEVPILDSRAPRLNGSSLNVSIRIEHDSRPEQTIVRLQTLRSENPTIERSSVLTRCVSDTAYIVCERKLIAWKAPSVGNNAAVSKPVSILPSQSHLSIGSATGTTELSHRLAGGTAPLEFNLKDSFDGVRIDRHTGTVYVDNSKVMTAACSVVDLDLQSKGGRNPRERTVRLVQQAQELLGRKPSGYPVLLPVCVTVTDALLSKDEIQYLVVLEVPPAMVQERSAKRNDEEQKQKLQLDPTRNSIAMERSDAPESVESMKRKIKDLEQRVEARTLEINPGRNEKKADESKSLEPDTRIKLEKTIEKAITLLENREFRTFIESIFEPSELEEIKRAGNFDTIIANFPKSNAPELLKALRTIRTATPRVSSDGKIVWYKSLDVGPREIAFVFVNGAWYIPNKPPRE